jgi:hypothetical protein
MGHRLHRKVVEKFFSIPDWVMGTEIAFKLTQGCLVIPHPMGRVSRVIKPWFEPTKS